MAGWPLGSTGWDAETAGKSERSRDAEAHDRLLQGHGMSGAAPDWDALRGAIAGEVILPGSPGYELARKPPIARFHDVLPAAVVRCATPADVGATVRLARRAGLPMATRSGGHCFAGHSSTRGVVIDVTPMRSVSVEGGVATVGAGARLGELYDSLAALGRTIPAGCGPSVGIAGLTLGGGLGILGRSYGLTSDHLRAAQAVLADGRVVDCDDHHDQDLLWALRGAGAGGFGVVTSLVFGTVPAPAVTSFHLVWPHGRAVPAIDAWQSWAPAAPDELAASLLVTAPADLGRPPAVHLFGAMLGAGPDTEKLLDELVVRVGADPASAALEHLPFRDAKRYLSELRVQGQSRELDFTPWGGAYNRVRADATAFVHRDARFLLKHAVVVGPGASPAERRASRRWLASSWAAVHPWGSGGVYPNFPDPDLDGWAHAYYGANDGRLRRG